MLAGAVAMATAIAVFVHFRRRAATRVDDSADWSTPAIVPPGPVTRLRGDFNGLFGQLLCLSHQDYGLGESGRRVSLQEGMIVQAWDDDTDDNGAPDDILATGVVERPPARLRHKGSRWVLRIDARGVYHQSDARAAEQRVGADGRADG
jgi:hypothetical protein